MMSIKHTPCILVGRGNWGQTIRKNNWKEGEIWIGVGITYKGPAISRQIKPLPIPHVNWDCTKIHKIWQFSSSALLWIHQFWFSSDKAGNSELISMTLGKNQTSQKAGKAHRGQGKLGAEIATGKKTNSRCMIKHGRVVALGYWESYGKWLN